MCRGDGVGAVGEDGAAEAPEMVVDPVAALERSDVRQAGAAGGRPNRPQRRNSDDVPLLRRPLGGCEEATGSWQCWRVK